MNLAQENLKNAWQASLYLRFGDTAVGTQLLNTKRHGPLNVQRAFFPEGKDCAHVYLLHPPAGIVSGDELHISIDVLEGAHALITTPGANRFYRAREDISIGDSKQYQHVEFRLAKDAKCENFPLETIVYDGADGVNEVDIYLHKNASYLGWDITCLGLPSSTQPFKSGSFTQLNRVFCDDEIIFHDRIAVHPNNDIFNHVAGLNAKHVFATFLAHVPLDSDQKSALEQSIDSLRAVVSENDAEGKVSITKIRGLLVMRYLGDNAEECKALFTELWQILRPIVMQKMAVNPRIWYT